MSAGITCTGAAEIAGDMQRTLETWASYKQIGELGELGKSIVDRNAHRALSAQQDPVTLARWKRRAQGERSKGVARPLLVKSGALRAGVAVGLKLQKWQQGKKTACIMPTFGRGDSRLMYGYVHQFGANPRRKLSKAIKRTSGSKWWAGHRLRRWNRLRKLRGELAGTGVWQLPRRRVFGISRLDQHQIVTAAERLKWTYMRGAQ